MPRINPEYREDARRKILDAALDAATENGWQALTLDEIAQRVGVTKGALYAYFENRDALFRELILEVFTRFRDDLMAALADNPEMPVVLGRISDLIFVRQKQYMSLFVEMTSSIPRDPVLKEQFIGIYGKNSGLFRDLIACRQAEGKLPKNGDPDELARAIVALAIGLRVTSIYLGFDAGKARQIWEHSVRLMLALPETGAKP
jgi:AcrR family transcriptional regulator